jgi:glycosyltransferase involved in cell wall biosynthesis
MTSVIIAAHNEEKVIGGCLEALLSQRTGSRLEIIVSANGCTDRTAHVARQYGGVTVIERGEAGKPGALNAAELVATSFPRIYLDADIVLPLDALVRLQAALDASPEVMVIVPHRRVDSQGRPLIVRGYFAINEKLPAFRDGLFGRGMIVLTEQGRSRFRAFPSFTADDLFLDSLFSEAEKASADGVEVVVHAPLRTADLVRRLVRVRRGNAQLRRALAKVDVQVLVRPSDKWAWLRQVVVHNPQLILAAFPYVAVTAVAGSLARRDSDDWGKDESTRARPPVLETNHL